MILIIYLFLNGLLHIIDMVSTYFYIKNLRKNIINFEDVEFNYHKYFFKWFGLELGTFLSSIISLSVILIFSSFLYFYNNNFILFITGLLFGVAYYSFISMFVKTKLYFKESYIKEKMIETNLYKSKKLR